MKLTDIDYKILKFVSKNPNCRKQDILKKFKSDKSIEYRLKKLTENKLDVHYHLFENSSYINHKCERTYIDCGFYDEVYSDCYFLNPVGYKVLSDYEKCLFNIKIKTFKHSFLYPILSSVITAVITAYITTKFLTK